MGLMSLLTFFEASSANSAAQYAARVTEQSAKEQKEFLINQQNQAYVEETKNMTKALFQELYKENGDVTKVNLIHLERIKIPIESRVKSFQKAFDNLEYVYYDFSKKSKIITLISIITTILCLLFISKEGSLLFPLCIALYVDYVSFTSYKKAKFWKKHNNEVKVERDEKENRLNNLYMEYPNLRAIDIVRKSYLDSIIYDIVETLLKNDNEQTVYNAYKSFLILLADLKPELVYFDKRFKVFYSF
jgi:hypothetical protein